MYSQNNEDEIIDKLFKKVGTTNRIFVEIGAGDGTECNTKALRLKKWKGMAFDRNFANEDVVKKLITIDNVVKAVREVLSKRGVIEDEFDFLSIDVDGNDYYLLLQLLIDGLRPRVICIEYNKHFGMENRVQGYKHDSYWDQTSIDFGASKKALLLLLEPCGYEFYGTDCNNVNCFFIRKEK